MIMQSSGTCDDRSYRGLQPFYDCIDMLTDDSSVVPHWDGKMQEQEGGVCVTVGAGCVARNDGEVNANKVVSDLYNDDCRKQSRNLLDRFAQDLRIYSNLVKLGDGHQSLDGNHDDYLMLGRTYAFLFEVPDNNRSGRAAKKDVFIGQVRSITTTVGKAGGGKAKYFFAVPRSDTSAMFCCHPYAKVTLQHGDLRLERYVEHHRYYHVCELGAGPAARGGVESSESSDSEYEEGERTTRGSKAKNLGTAILQHVNILWHANADPEVMDVASKDYLCKQCTDVMATL